jgi:uncharacterized protein (TIGR02117 family)
LPRILIAIIATPFLVLAAFALIGWVGSSIPRNPNWRQAALNDPSAVEIMVETNGVHTALVLPLVTSDKDWRGEFPATDLRASWGDYTHISISWGEREVFLNTPTWWDLRPVTVLRIMGLGGEGLIHVAQYIRPAPADDIRPLRLTRTQYRRLVASIEGSLPKGPRIRHPGYGDQDVFYDAPGHYTPRNTCNQWTSDQLAAAGIKTGWWTPFAGGVMKWVPESRGIG